MNSVNELYKLEASLRKLVNLHALHVPSYFIDAH